MNSKTKSLIRHILTGLGSVLVFFGVTTMTDAIQYISENLDIIWEAGLTIVGFVTTVYGFFRDKERLEPTPEVSNE